MDGPGFCGLAARGDLPALEALLKQGVSPDSVDQRGTPALVYALDAPNPLAVVKLLLAHQARTRGWQTQAGPSSLGEAVQAALSQANHRPDRARVVEQLRAIERLDRETGSVAFDETTNTFNVERDPSWRGLTVFMPREIVLRRTDGFTRARVITVHEFSRFHRGWLTSVGPRVVIGAKSMPPRTLTEVLLDPGVLVSRKTFEVPNELLLDETRSTYRFSLDDLGLPPRTATWQLSIYWGPTSAPVTFTVRVVD